jgi:hypothetical protein
MVLICILLYSIVNFFSIQDVQVGEMKFLFCAQTEKCGIQGNVVRFGVQKSTS